MREIDPAFSLSFCFKSSEPAHHRGSVLFGFGRTKSREEIDFISETIMPKPEDLFRIFGILLLSLTSIGLVSQTAKIMLRRRGSGEKPIDLVYDSDIQKNQTGVCPFSYLSDPDSDPHRIRHKQSPCFKKTLMQWYIPWVKHFIWHQFENDNRKRRRKKKEKLEAQENQRLEKKSEYNNGNSIAQEIFQRDAVKMNEKASRVVYTISAALLVASATFACWEVFKEKAKKTNPTEQANKSRGGRKFSLADFTVDRHLRRESRQAEMQQVQRQPSFDRSSKVTQTLIHQGSLDRAISKIGSEGKVKEEVSLTNPFLIFFCWHHYFLSAPSK